MPLLSDSDRQYVLKQLRAAPDSVLIDAMLALNVIRTKTIEVRKIAEGPAAPDNAVKSMLKTAEAGLAAAETMLEEAKAKTERPNVPPGKPSITKIGSNTKEELLRILSQGNQPPAKFVEHLKLLWDRGEVQFDGKEWYL